MGMGIVLSAALCSALADVYLEKMFKDTKTVSFWLRNAHLAMFSILFALPVLDWKATYQPGGMMRSMFTPLTILCIFSNAYGGILAGMVIKNASALTKDITLGSSIVLAGK